MNHASCTEIVGAIRQRRRPHGMVAVLMPFTAAGAPDLDGLVKQLQRVSAAGLTAAVNMDTGYGQRLSPAQRDQVLALTAQVFPPPPTTTGDHQGGHRFVAGAFVDDGDGALGDEYARAMDAIERHGGTSILFPCPELRALPETSVIDLFARVADGRRAVLLFELGEMFVPYGRIYSLPTFAALLDLPSVVGLKHSSLNRQAEWARLALRDQRRPDFRVYTGNDLAIDMIMYGSDYLLGLAAFHPEAFAERDRRWAAGDARFYALNDLLQYLGAFAFRPPVPAYRHAAAMFLRLRGLIDGDAPPTGAPTRPETDRAVLADLLERIEAELAA
ncbi:MAG TPA: dihydrodipicolinate synthase family protein [Polyangia bacterium]|jgi:dihydrodipicolinate synthase/N-acetylneuraminate lyase